MLGPPIVNAAASSKADELWYERLLDHLVDAGGIFAAILGAIAVAGLLRGLWRKTLGRRRDRYARLRRLGTNAQLAYFTSVLGEPPAMRRTFESEISRFDEYGRWVPDSKTFIEVVYIDRDFYVQALTDVDETVHAYSVTTRSKHFRPSFRPPGGFAVERHLVLRRLGLHYRYERNRGIKLGKTRFAELMTPNQAASWVGAHNAHYFEAVYLGNPGLYQTFVYSINDAGAWVWDAGFDDRAMHTFSWGFNEPVLDPKLALAQAVAEADAAESDHASVRADDLQSHATPGDKLAGEDEPEGIDGGEAREVDVPAYWGRFRRRSRVNTYTVIGPELALDDYPLARRKLYEPGTIFGVNYHRVRTVER